MKLHIKNMVSSRCKMIVKQELQKLGLHFIIVELGEVELMEDIMDEQREQVRIALLQSGLELLDDRRSVLIEKIKYTVVEMVHHNQGNVVFCIVGTQQVCVCRYWEWLE